MKKIHKISLGILAFFTLYIAVSDKPNKSSPVRPRATAVAESTDPNWTKESLVLKDLIQSHPHKEIREDLFQMIEKSQIFLNFQEDLGAAAVATVLYSNTPTHGLVMVLSINQSALLDRSISRIYKQLVIYHEWIHIKQQKEQRYPKEFLFGRKMTVPMSQTELKLYFAAETEAYSAECDLADQHGATDEAPFCRTRQDRGERVFRQEIALNYASLSAFAASRQGFLEIARTAD